MMPDCLFVCVCVRVSHSLFLSLSLKERTRNTIKHSAYSLRCFHLSFFFMVSLRQLKQQLFYSVSKKKERRQQLLLPQIEDNNSIRVSMTSSRNKKKNINPSPPTRPLESRNAEITCLNIGLEFEDEDKINTNEKSLGILAIQVSSLISAYSYALKHQKKSKMNRFYEGTSESLKCPKSGRNFRLRYIPIEDITLVNGSCRKL